MVNARALAPSETRRLRVPTAGELLRSEAASALAALVPAPRMSQLIDLADQFPLPVLMACCECRLDAEDARVDLALCVLPASDARTRAAIDVREAPDWHSSLEFLRRWSAFDHELTSAIPFVWVAFDLESEQSALPVPCLGLCVDPVLLPRRLGLALDGLDAACDPLTLAASTHRMLWGRPLPARTRELMIRALYNTNPLATARHFSYMSSRMPATFKLDVRLATAALEPFLARLGWPGPSARIGPRVRELAPEQSELQLNLVLEPELSQPLEVELLTDPTHATEANRNALLSRLVALGLCSRDKAAALSGVGRRRNPHDRAGISWYAKVRVQDDRPCSAKAYACITPRFAWR